MNTREIFTFCRSFLSCYFITSPVFILRNSALHMAS